VWKNKKVLVIGLIAVLVLLGSLGGIAIAQAADNTGSTASGNATQPKSIMARAAEILGIDQSKLESAFTTARQDAATDALKTKLQAMVTAGKITQAQADDYLKWWQSKPDMSQYQNQVQQWMQSRPTLPSDVQQWKQGQPDIQVPGGLNGRGFNKLPAGPGMRGMMGVR
jgi:hypothetical protein